MSTLLLLSIHIICIVSDILDMFDIYWESFHVSREPQALPLPLRHGITQLPCQCLPGTERMTANFAPRQANINNSLMARK